MKRQQIDQRSTKQVRIDTGLHKLLKLKATEAGISIKGLLEEFLAEILAVESS